MATPAEYFDNADINNIPVPDWSHLDVTSPTNSPTVKLNWDQIYINHEEGNITKEEQHTAAEIEALRLSFAAQVDEKEFPPAVKYRGKEYAKPWNFGPSLSSNITVRELVDIVKKHWKHIEVEYESPKNEETKHLILDSSKAYNKLKWKPVWGIDSTINYTIDW